ncbi:MAG: TRAP transporter TatT component family protein [Pseudomonadaceae bacterium]|nr:TRAP transporter TatT component family protein [Pseudomonadaceae bacterium]
MFVGLSSLRSTTGKLAKSVRGLCSRRQITLVLAGMSMLILSGCQTVIGTVAGGLASDLSDAILNSTDPELVREAAPAYLLLVDSQLSEGGSPELLGQAASLNGAYSAAFVSDPERARKFAEKALAYAERSACGGLKNACDLRSRDFALFEEWVATIELKHVPMAYVLATSWAGYIQANADDWAAIAELARVKVLMARVAELDETYDNGGPHLYQGVFETLLPPAMGGRPQKGREHFERAIAISDGRHLIAKVYFARQYARLVFDRELHDELLNEVLSADVNAPDLTLTNTIAQQQARELLETADEYF